MSKKNAFCIRFSKTKIYSPAHDKREKSYMERMRNSDDISERSVVMDIDDSRSDNNIYYELNHDKTLEQWEEEASKLYEESLHQKPQPNTLFIRPAILNVNDTVTMDMIKEMGEVVFRETGMTLIAAYYHADEGHMERLPDGKKTWHGNYHIHAYFLSQHLKDVMKDFETIDKDTGEVRHITEIIIKKGRTCRNIPMSRLQGILAPVFNMERGDIYNSDTMAYLSPKEKFAVERKEKAAQIIKADAKLADLIQRQESISAQIKEAESQLLEINTSSSKANEKKSKIEADILRLNSELDLLSTKEQELKDLQKRRTIIEQNLKQTEERISELEAYKTRLERQVTSAQNVIELLREAETKKLEAEAKLQKINEDITEKNFILQFKMKQMTYLPKLPLTIVRFLDNMRDMAYNNINALLNKIMKCKFIAIKRTQDESGHWYNILEIEQNGIHQFMHVYEETGDIFLIKDGISTKMQRYPALHDYVTARINREQLALLEAALHVSFKAKEQKEQKEQKKYKMRL